MKVPAGLYVHWPYCRSRCGYCAFVVTTDESSRQIYLSALEREIGLVASEAVGQSFDSIYLGGGTPSLFPAESLASLQAVLAEAFAIEPDAEVTLEANPEDVSVSLAHAWRQAGVTRVSVGVQSFEDRELEAVGRRHDAGQAARALETLLSCGFSVSGDLILGLPEQTPQSFRASVERLAGLGVGHLSVYLLEAEKSREIEQDRRHRPSHYLSDDAQADLWLELSPMLASYGLRHYEISNWARRGQEARHNTKYWTRAPTLGLGVSAHELWREHRRANVSAITAYLVALGAGRRPLALDQEVSEGERQRERIVLGLRLADGVDRSEIEGWIRRSQDAMLSQDWKAWGEAGLLEETGHRFRLTERGFLLSNEILCRFV